MGCWWGGSPANGGPSRYLGSAVTIPKVLSLRQLGLTKKLSVIIVKALAQRNVRKTLLITKLKPRMGFLA